MKKLILGAMIITAMSSCSKNEIVDNSDSQKPVAIEFAKAQLGNSVISKAEAGTSDMFIVSAFNKGTAYAEITSKTLKQYNSTWALGNGTAAETFYYPIDDSEVTFWSYRNAELDGNTPTISNTGITINATIKSTTNNADFVVTETAKNVKETTASPIVLNHTHILSQLTFTGQVANATDWTITVDSLKVEAFPSAIFTTNTWATPSGDKGTWTSISNTNPAAISSTTAASIGTSINLIPQNGVAVKAEVKLVHTTYGTKTKTVTGTVNLAKGSTHKVNIKVDPTNELVQIEFGTPTVGDWTTGNGSEIYNGDI